MQNEITENTQNKIDMQEVVSLLLAKRKLFVRVLVVTFVAAVAWIFPQPRSYQATVTLAPETSAGISTGALGDIAASFGFDLGAGQNIDAFYPLLYPSLLESTDFVVGLFDVRVKNLAGDIDTDYYTYMTKHQKHSFWHVPILAVKRWIGRLTAKPEMAPSAGKGANAKADPFFLTQKQDETIEAITDHIRCSVDKKTEVISITVKDQDRLICATMADSIRVRLQQYIIDYRTRKARVDVNYYKELLEKAKADYEVALSRYNGFSDSHLDAVLTTTASRKEALNNDVQGKLTIVNTLTAQLQAAEAKLQERTPAFTVIQRASVPVKPSAPKRMIFVLCMLIFATIVTAAYVLRGELLQTVAYFGNAGKGGSRDQLVS